MTLAWAYSELKKPEQSFASAIAALGLAKATGDPEIEGGIENSMMLGFRKQHRPEEAIFFGLHAVNSYRADSQEHLRYAKGSSRLDSRNRESGAYRMLAELLVETGRLGQAEQILDLLKEQELKDLVAGAAPGATANIEPLKLSPAQHGCRKRVARSRKESARHRRVEPRVRAIRGEGVAHRGR